MKASIAHELVEWTSGFKPSADDLALADRSLKDTGAAAMAAGDRAPTFARSLTSVGRWAAAAHLEDFDDLHMPSTAHISAVCVPASLAASGSAEAYLVGAGVMSRIGSALGWRHYNAGWHATTTSGAIGAAAAAAYAWGLTGSEFASALALAVPGAGGVQRAFGTDAKSLQVGMAVENGLRAARLAAEGHTTAPDALEEWMRLLGGTRDDLPITQVAVPGGLGIKMFPACYALQRPMAAVLEMRAAASLEVEDIIGVEVSTPTSTLRPLIHDVPSSGLEAKFSLPHAVAIALSTEHPSLRDFTNTAVSDAATRRLAEKVSVNAENGGDGLLAGKCVITVRTTTDSYTIAIADPPGAPGNPPSIEQLRRKFEDCRGSLQIDYDELTWSNASDLFDTVIGATRG